MSNKEGDLGERFLDGTWRRVIENSEYMGSRERSKSSSSSGGSNDPQAQPDKSNSDQHLTTQSATSILQRSQVTLESGLANLPLINITESQQAGNLFLKCTSAATSQLHPSTMADTGTGSQAQSHLQISGHDVSATTFGPQEYRFQNWLDQEIGSNNFHPIQLQDMAIQKGTGASLGLSPPLQLEGIPINSFEKMKMPWQSDNIPSMPQLHSLNLISKGQGSLVQSYNFPNNVRFMRNTVYDPMYEATGLPIDPHLRMFNARRDNGDGEP